MHANTFRPTAMTHLCRTGALSTIVSSINSLLNKSFGARRMGSFDNHHDLTILQRYCFQLHVPPQQRLTVTAPSFEEMAGTRRRTVVSRSSAVQESRFAIQILQDQAIPALEPVNQEGI